MKIMRSSVKLVMGIQHDSRFYLKRYITSLRLWLIIAIILTVLNFMMAFTKSTGKYGSINIDTWKKRSLTVSRETEIKNKSSTLHTIFENIKEANATETTVVSAYINIGPFQKSDTDKRNEGVYIKWMIMFKSLLNPLVFYTNSEASMEFVLKIREGLPTKVVKIDQNSTWAWSLLEKIEKCHSKPGQYLPSHFTPIYLAMTHAKFEFVRDACEQNHFSTRYITWLDVGTYRDIIKSREDGYFHPFVLRPPEYFDPTKVAMNKVGKWENRVGFLKILDEIVFVIAGCLFIGEIDVMKKFTDDYKKHVEIILEKYNRTNSEEQILEAMYAATDSPFFPAVQLQLYMSDQWPVCWVCLAWHLRNRGILGDGLKIYNRTSTAGRLQGMKRNMIVTKYHL